MKGRFFSTAIQLKTYKNNFQWLINENSKHTSSHYSKFGFYFICLQANEYFEDDIGFMESKMHNMEDGKRSINITLNEYRGK